MTHPQGTYIIYSVTANLLGLFHQGTLVNTHTVRIDTILSISKTPGMRALYVTIFMHTLFVIVPDLLLYIFFTHIITKAQSA